MCIAIIPVHETDVLRVSFVLETIYFGRDGTRRAVLDLLLSNEKNSGSIKHFRIACPDSLVDVPTAQGDPQELVDLIKNAQEQQRDAVSLHSSELLEPNSEANWIYTLLPHVETVPGKSGTFSVRRDFHDGARGVLSGPVADQWTVNIPAALEPITWLLYATIDATILDLQTDNDSAAIAPGQERWFRIMIMAPIKPFNRIPSFAKLLVNHRTYLDTFKSPIAVHETITSQVNSFIERTSGQGGVAIAKYLSPRKQDQGKILNDMQKSVLFHENVRKYVPARVAGVDDWRTFIYMEHGLGFEMVNVLGRGAPPPHWLGYYSLPHEADPAGARRVPLPRPFQSLFSGPRRSICYELFFGKDHHETDPYQFQFLTTSRNLLYTYLAWLSPIALLISLIVVLRCWIR